MCLKYNYYQVQPYSCVLFCDAPSSLISIILLYLQRTTIPLLAARIFMKAFCFSNAQDNAFRTSLEFFARCSDVQTLFVGRLKNSWYNVWFYLHHLWSMYFNTRYLVLSATNFLSKEYMFVAIWHGFFLERDLNHVSSGTTLISHICILVHVWNWLLYQLCAVDFLPLCLITVFYSADCVVSCKSNMESWPKLNSQGNVEWNVSVFDLYMIQYVAFPA